MVTATSSRTFLTTLWLLQLYVCVFPSVCGQRHPTTGYTVKKRETCLPPQFVDCSFHQLTAPLGQTFSIYCIVEGRADGGAVNATWSRLSGSLDSNRTVITATGDSFSKNVSIVIFDLQRSDQDTYILLAANSCGRSNHTVAVVVRNGSCNGYQPPNATHIISYSAMEIEGDHFTISCDFDGDTDPSHYSVEWSKGPWLDIVFYGSPDKYQSYRGDTCPDEPCCSFQDILVVQNATRNDTDLYSCIAWAAPSGAPQGNSLSVYIVVAPWPTILTPPESTDAIEGQAVQLSCKISGFPNATLVQWTRNSSILDVSDSSKYSTRRHMVNATEDVFVETLQFAVSPDLEGHYACCVSVLREEENAPTGSGWIDESDCSTYGTVTIDHGNGFFSGAGHILAAAVASASCALLVAFLVQTFVWCRRRHRTTKVGYRLIDEQQPPVDYGTNQGTTHPGEGLTHSLLNPVGARAQKGPRKPWVLLVHDVGAEGEPPTQHARQIQRLSHFLRVQKIFCIESVTENIERAIQDAGCVVIIFSKALHAALTNTDDLNTVIRTNFGNLTVRTLRELMTDSPTKFIPVSLSGGPCECRELHSQRGYNLTALEACLQQLPEEDISERRIAKVLKKEEFSEVRGLVRALQQQSLR